MSVTIVNAVLDDLLIDQTNNSMPELRLFQDDQTPSAGDQIADYDEADFSGYSTKSWGAASFDTDHAKHLSGPNDFVHNGGGIDNDIYGYWVHDGSEVLLARRFNTAPIVMDGSPDTIHYDSIEHRLHRWGDGPARDFLMPDDYLKKKVDDYAGYPAGGLGNIEVHLFTNNHTPAVGDVEGDYTKATFSGYTFKRFDSNEATVSSGVATSLSDLLTFTRNSDSGASETIYGYYILISLSASYRFVGAQLFDSPKVMQFNGDYLEFKFRIRLRNLSG